MLKKILISDIQYPIINNKKVYLILGDRVDIEEKLAKIGFEPIWAESNNC